MHADDWQGWAVSEDMVHLVNASVLTDRIDEALSIQDTAKIVFYVTGIILNLVCNCIAIYTLLCRKPSRPSIKFIYALCVKNLALGLTLQVLITALLFSRYLSLDDYWCHTSAILFISYILISSWCVVLISVDRYVAIRKALQYSNWFTHKTCIVLILMTFILGFTAASLQELNWDTIAYNPQMLICMMGAGLRPEADHYQVYMLTIVVLGFVLPLLLNCYIYGSIYIATKNTTALARRNSIQPLIDANCVIRKDARTGTENQLKLPRANGLRRLSGQLKVHKDNRKAAKMGALVVVEQVIVWLPFNTILLLQTVGAIDSVPLDWIAIANVFLDSFTSPIIYVLRNKSSKAIFMSCFGMTRKPTMKQQPAQTQSTTLRLMASHISDDT